MTQITHYRHLQTPLTDGDHFDHFQREGNMGGLWRIRRLQFIASSLLAAIWAIGIVMPSDCVADSIPAPVQASSSAEAELVDRINQRLRDRWRQEQIVPAARADDAEYLRRVSLDLTGRIPAVAEVRAFLADPDPGKRRRVVEDMLNGPRYVIHSSNVWRAEFLPEVGTNPQLQFLMPSFEAWLRDQLIDNDSYADLARNLVAYRPTTDRGTNGTPAEIDLEAGNVVSPMAFFQAKEGKPENLAASAARLFQGVRIECAQCHDHPFDHWKQEQFWSLAAFYADQPGPEELRPPGETAANNTAASNTAADDPARQIQIPDKKILVTARYLDGSEPDWQTTAGGRENLAAWLTSERNPAFARAAVNRVWGRLFGVGIVEPVDDFSESNVPSHPELLDELATAFVQSGYDLKFLLRVLTATEAYQLTSSLSHPSQESPQLFARMSLKGLSPEQLFDSLCQATGHFERQQRGFALQNTTPQSEILDLFNNDAETPTQRSTTILQSLAMMNGEFIRERTQASEGILAAIIEFPDMSLDDRIETLYLATLSRLPGNDERRRLRDYCQSKTLDRALSDILWSLLNCNEFVMNH